MTPQDTESPYHDTHVIVAFKRMADDLRYFYTEAAIARPNQRSTVRPAQIRQWIWTWVLLFRQPSKKWSPAAKVWKKT